MFALIFITLTSLITFLLLAVLLVLYTVFRRSADWEKSSSPAGWRTNSAWISDSFQGMEMTFAPSMRSAGPSIHSNDSCIITREMMAAIQSEGNDKPHMQHLSPPKSSFLLPFSRGRQSQS